MLAHQHGLALITEKLQNQRLEEPAAGSSGVAPSGNASTSFGPKLPGVSQESFLISDHSGHGGYSSALSVKGKNVWMPSVETHQKSPGLAPTHPSSSPRSILPSVCRHKKLRHLCQICEPGPGTPTAPPKKKHCRSLSVPPDGPSAPPFFLMGKDSSISPGTRFSIGIGGQGSHQNYHHHCPPSCHSHSSHHHSHHHPPHPSKIWRPIAVVPLRGAATSPSSSSSSPASSLSSISSPSNKNLNNFNVDNHNHKKDIDRACSNTLVVGSLNNPHNVTSLDDGINLSMHGLNDNDRFSTSSLLSTSVSGFDEHNNNNITGLPTHNYSYNPRVPPPVLASVQLQNLNKYKLMVAPSSSSSASFDSGHFTTSDFQTPPNSPPPAIPEPRPASAASDTSFSSLGWCDFSPMANRHNTLQNRSLSCEDRISNSPACCSNASSPIGAASNNTISMPCVYNMGHPCCIARQGGGGKDGAGGAGGGVCCPHYHVGGGDIRIPRCHSQPCVLHHRRCGKKRRRDCDRPTLNFNKMTETAYISSQHFHRKSEPWSSPSYDAQMRLWKNQGHTNFLKSNAIPNPFALNPIASSPLDPSSEALMSKHVGKSPRRHHSGGSAGGTSASQRQKIHRTSTTRHSLSPPSQNDKQDDVDDDDDDDDEVIGIVGDGEVEEEDGNCSCHSNQRESEGVGIIPLGDFDDLDLEQIESH